MMKKNAWFIPLLIAGNIVLAEEADEISVDVIPIPTPLPGSWEEENLNEETESVVAAKEESAKTTEEKKSAGSSTTAEKKIESVAPEKNSGTSLNLSNLVFNNPYEVTNKKRMAITPGMNGELDTQFWDMLSSSNNMLVFHNWEPGVNYFGARVPNGKDVVFSLNLSGSAWLMGEENHEIRVTWHGDKPVYTIRTVDSSNPGHPVFGVGKIVREQIKLVGKQDVNFWNMELKLLGMGRPGFEIGNKISVRADSINKFQQTPLAIVPRVLNTVELAFERSVNDIPGLSWDASYNAKVRNVQPGSNFGMNWKVAKPDNVTLKRIKIAPFGMDKEYSTSLSTPMPEYNSYGNAYAPFSANIPKPTPYGYYLMQAKLYRSDDKITLLQSCFQVARPVEFKINYKAKTKKSPTEQTVDGYVTVHSLTTSKLGGRFRLELPAGWELLEGADSTFSIFHPYGHANLYVKFKVPANFSGLAPIKYRVDLGEKIVQQTVYFQVYSAE